MRVACKEARLHDVTVYYAIGRVESLDAVLAEAGDRVILVPARLAASLAHAIQAAVLAIRNASRGLSRARRVPLEALLYLLAAHGIDPLHTSLSEVASRGPKSGDVVVAVSLDKGACERVASMLAEGEPSWSGIPESVALARTALAAAEVERRRLQRVEETA